MIPGLRTFNLGVKSLSLHKLRSALTMLGILFGVSSVIAMLSVGEGTSQKVQDDIRELGSTNILLRSRKPPEAQTTEQVSLFQAQEYGLTYLDADVIAQTLPSVEVVVPVRETPKDVWAGDRKLLGKVFGTVPAYMDITGLKVREGRWLTDHDFRSTANVVVLSGGAADKLFPIKPPLRENILLGKERFTVIGVLEARKGRTGGSSAAAADNREGLFVPLSTARSWFGETTIKMSSGSTELERVQLHQVQVRVKDPEDVIATAAVVRNMLQRNHRKEDYEVVVPLELLLKAEESKKMFNIVLGAIAGISLLVGGIGIMNVMLATVTERTREIGIRRALGAKRRHIVSQFLVETVVLSGCGGLLGVAVGVVLPGLVTRFSEFTTIVRPEFAFLAFGISAMVGIVAGLYPAIRAARMDPVEALRHE
jgi:putative ABC transport system permease protein